MVTRKVKEARIEETQEMERKKANFLHLVCARRPLIWRRNIGSKEKSNAGFAKNLVVLKIL